ncbi:MAG: hypothetical protein NT154_17135 [Verrucomicrobia bacterium]|nr:hypothetical protein [Verrucomicrobiota bacterium]
MPFVVFLEVKEAVAPDATPGHAVDVIHFDNGMLPGGLAVVAKEVVTRGDEQLADLDHKAIGV